MNVLMADDGSDQALRAIREAMRLLPLHAAHVTIIGVTGAPRFEPDLAYAFAGAGAGGVYVEMPAAIDHGPALQLLEAARIPVQVLDRHGDAVEKILATAQAQATDVIVMGSHGRGAIAGALFGSVSQGVLHHFAGALLIVR